MKPLVWCLGLCACGHATSAPPAAPQLGTALAPLEFYVGTWDCDGTQFDDKGTATQHMKLRIRVAPAYANWLRIEVFDGDKQLTSELKGVDGKGVYHHVWTSDDGSSGSLTSATGWQGNAIAFDEDHPDPTGKTRMTFRKIDATHYTHEAEVDTGGGYHLDFEKACHKML